MTAPLGPHEVKLTYHQKTGQVSVQGLRVPDMLHLAVALRDAADRANDATDEQFFASLAAGADEIVDRTKRLGHGNAVVSAEVPWMERLQPKNDERQP